VERCCRDKRSEAGSSEYRALGVKIIVSCTGTGFARVFVSRSESPTVRSRVFLAWHLADTYLELFSEEATVARSITDVYFDNGRLPETGSAVKSLEFPGGSGARVREMERARGWHLGTICPACESLNSMMGAWAIGSYSVHQACICEDSQFEVTAFFALTDFYIGHPGRWHSARFSDRRP
jgi:hypothetical protein